jgi:hypothetical protein
MDVARVLGFLERELDLLDRLDPGLVKLPERVRALRFPPDCFFSAIQAPSGAAYETRARFCRRYPNAALANAG